MSKSPIADIELTQADVKTMYEALNGYIHFEKNCAQNGPHSKFYKVQQKLERYLCGG